MAGADRTWGRGTIIGLAVGLGLLAAFAWFYSGAPRHAAMTYMDAVVDVNPEKLDGIVTPENRVLDTLDDSARTLLEPSIRDGVAPYAKNVWLVEANRSRWDSVDVVMGYDGGVGGRGTLRLHAVLDRSSWLPTWKIDEMGILQSSVDVPVGPPAATINDRAVELSRGYKLPAMPGGYQFGVDPGDGPFQVEARYKIFEPARVSDTTVTLAHTLNEALYADIRQGVLEHLAECVDVANGVEPATDACARLTLKTPQEGEELRLVAVSPVSTERGYLGGIAVEAEVHAEHVTADGVPVPGTAQHVTWEGEIAPGPDGQLLVEHR